MEDLYLALGIAIVLFSSVGAYALFRRAKEFFDGWTFIETDIYQNRSTHDIVVVAPESMIYDEAKKAYVRKENHAKRIYLYDKIKEEELNDKN